MNTNENKDLLSLEEEIKQLPEKFQRALCWLIDNFDFAEEICKNPVMTYEEIEKYKKDALAKEDYIVFILSCIAQTYIT